MNIEFLQDYIVLIVVGICLCVGYILKNKGGHRIIPDTITAGTAFSKDELGWWGDNLYKLLIDSNVWTPDQYAAGW